jgi:peptidoglycan/xylan/chitin deacetylase (PgdA/CDA1 family)
MQALKHRLLDLCVGLLHYTKLHRLLCPFFVGNGVILVLHRVLPESAHPRIAANSRIEITPQFLEQLIQFFLGLGYEIVSLDTVYERLTKAEKGRPFVCFTFDDGYADASEVIYPIFKRYQLPYAVYVVTDFPDRKSILWWYMLEDLVLHHDSVRFCYREKDYTFTTIHPADRETAYTAIRELILSVPREQAGEVIDAVFSGYSITSQEYEKQQMTWEQIIELAHDPLVTIGAHTVHHYNLKQLTSDQVRWEIQTSRERLEEKIKAPVLHFSYPFGSRDEVGIREFELAAQCGFHTLTTVREGNIFPEHRQHLECLPRVEITGRHQNLTLVDLRRCGLVSLLRNRLQRVVTV